MQIMQSVNWKFIRCILPVLQYNIHYEDYV